MEMSLFGLELMDFTHKAYSFFQMILLRSAGVEHFFTGRLISKSYVYVNVFCDPSSLAMNLLIIKQ